MGPNAKELSLLAYKVMDAIQHDWDRGPVELEPSVKFELTTQLIALRNEITELLRRLGTPHA